MKQEESIQVLGGQIAQELVKSHTDPNELAKAFTYLRTHRDGRQFFTFLNTLVTKGGYLLRSGRTLDYYREILRVCEKFLKPYQDKPDEMAQILGWAVRLMRYYAIEPTLAPPPKVKPTPAAPSQVELAHPKRIQDLRVGMLLKGRVVRIQPYGAFVDIGVGRNGLVHISELADRQVSSVEEVVSVGDEVTVRVKGVDVERGRIELSMKGIAS
jgi:hypothetical protein